MTTLRNLIVDLDAYANGSPVLTEAADDRTLAWIDEAFGGWWSSEAVAGSNVIARRADGAPIGFATFDAKGLPFRWLMGLGRERDVGIFGPFGLAEEERKTGLGVFLLRQTLRALRQRGYARALIPAVGSDELLHYYADAAGARVAETFERAELLAPPPRVLVMASGSGSNFQAVLDAAHAGELPIEIVGLICNNPRAYAIERARAAGIAVEILEWRRKEETRAEYDGRLLAAARSVRPDLVLLLGWMHLLAESFVETCGEMLNVHPAFLPLDPRRDDVVMPDGTRMAAFRGPHAVADALEADSRWTGATVHRVTRATDRGPVMARKPLRIEAEEGEEKLMERLHAVEHRLVATAVTRWLFERPPAS